MRHKNLEWDLLVIDVLTLLLIVIVLIFHVPLIHEILGLLFIFYFPGYVLIAAIFPKRKDLGTATHVALSLGLSIAVSIFIGLVLAATPIGFTFNSILTALSIFILIVSGIAWYLRRRYREVDISKIKIFSFFITAIQSYRKAGWGYRTLVIILLCLILSGLGSWGYILTRPLPAQSFSEFYILGAGGKAEAYPRELHVGEQGRVIVSVVSHENQVSSYSIQVKADGVKLSDLADFTLNPGEKWQQEAGFTLWTTGKNQKVEFILNKHGTSLYETLYIWVNVSE